MSKEQKNKYTFSEGAVFEGQIIKHRAQDCDVGDINFMSNLLKYCTAYVQFKPSLCNMVARVQ